MADNLLQIDDDWKRQAQEEKRRLAEEAEKKKSQVSSAAAVSSAPVGAGGTSPMGRRAAQAASFPALVQTLMTQALYYLGEIGSRSGQTFIDLDMAKLQIDLLAVLEEKTKNNLKPDEQQLLDTALYETRMRFVAVAREHATV
jgi:hypothetical protein